MTHEELDLLVQRQQGEIDRLSMVVDRLYQVSVLPSQDREQKLLDVVEANAAALSNELAELLVNKSWGLSLGGLRELSGPVASWVSGLSVASLCLNGIEVVDLDALDRIEVWNIKFLYLNGLTRMDPPLAHALMSGSAILHLNGLETLDQGTAAALSRARTKSWQEIHQ